MSNPKCTVEELRQHYGISDISSTPEYRVWNKIKQRCYNQRNDSYRLYGGRGITVSDEWRTSFTRFLADMGIRPSLKHSLDRINNNGPYSLTNCRWATPCQQQRNRCNNHIVEI